MTALLEIEGMRAGYGQGDVVHGIDLHVDQGEVALVLGANGAGKTTTMRAISGMVARSGRVLFEGQDISALGVHAIVRRGIAHVPEGRGTFPELSVDDNLRAGGYVLGRRAPDRRRWYEIFPQLAQRQSQKAGSLSGGEQQMLAIARALMGRPKLLLCDEPSLGLAPLIVRDLFRVLTDLNKEEGLSVLLVEQNANIALEIASRAYVLETGQIVLSGRASELAGDESLRRAYLGY